MGAVSGDQSPKDAAPSLPTARQAPLTQHASILLLYRHYSNNCYLLKTHQARSPTTSYASPTRMSGRSPAVGLRPESCDWHLPHDPAWLQPFRRLVLHRNAVHLAHNWRVDYGLHVLSQRFFDRSSRNRLDHECYWNRTIATRPHWLREENHHASRLVDIRGWPSGSSDDSVPGSTYPFDCCLDPLYHRRKPRVWIQL